MNTHTPTPSIGLRPLAGIVAGLFVTDAIMYGVLVAVAGEPDPNPPRRIPNKVALPYVALFTGIGLVLVYTWADVK